MLELVIALPFLLTLLLGIFEAGYLIYSKSAAERVVQDAVRFGTQNTGPGEATRTEDEILARIGNMKSTSWENFVVVLDSSLTLGGRDALEVTIQFDQPLMSVWLAPVVGHSVALSTSAAYQKDI